MPLILNDPVGCKHSIFNHTDFPSAASVSASRNIGVWICSGGMFDTRGIVADLPPVNTRTQMLQRRTDRDFQSAVILSRRQTHRRFRRPTRPSQTSQKKRRQAPRLRNPVRSNRAIDHRHVLRPASLKKGMAGFPY